MFPRILFFTRAIRYNAEYMTFGKADECLPVLLGAMSCSMGIVQVLRSSVRPCLASHVGARTVLQLWWPDSSLLLYLERVNLKILHCLFGLPPLGLTILSRLVDSAPSY